MQIPHGKFSKAEHNSAKIVRFDTVFGRSLQLNSDFYPRILRKRIIYPCIIDSLVYIAITLMRITCRWGCIRCFCILHKCELIFAAVNYSIIHTRVLM